MNGFERRRKEKMDKILSTAFELFFTRGFKAVSIDEIAKKANVSQVSIYNFFGNKDNLLRQSIFSYYNLIFGEYKVILNSNLPFSEKFQKIFFKKMESLDQYGEEFLKPHIIKDPVIQGFINEYYQNHSLPFMINLIEQGKKEGFINPNLSIDAILIYINMFKEMFYKTNLSIKLGTDLSLLFFHGILGKSNMVSE